MTIDQEIARATPTDDGCLIAAPGASTKDGARLVWLDGRMAQLHRAIVARESPLRADELVMRTCHDQRCIAAGHLRIGSNEDRNEAMVAAGRHAHGERHPSHVLTEVDVHAIHRLRGRGWLYREIGKEFGVSGTLCRYICIGRKWRHVWEQLQ